MKVLLYSVNIIFVSAVFVLDLISHSEEIIKFGAARKTIKFGNFCHFAPDFLRVKIFPHEVKLNAIWDGVKGNNVPSMIILCKIVNIISR